CSLAPPCLTDRVAPLGPALFGNCGARKFCRLANLFKKLFISELHPLCGAFISYLSAGWPVRHAVAGCSLHPRKAESLSEGNRRRHDPFYSREFGRSTFTRSPLEPLN